MKGSLKLYMERVIDKSVMILSLNSRYCSEKHMKKQSCLVTVQSCEMGPWESLRPVLSFIYLDIVCNWNAR